MYTVLKNLALVVVKLSPLALCLGFFAVGLLMFTTSMPWPLALFMCVFFWGFSWDLFRTSYLGSKL